MIATAGINRHRERSAKLCTMWTQDGEEMPKDEGPRPGPTEALELCLIILPAACGRGEEQWQITQPGPRAGL